MTIEDIFKLRDLGEVTKVQFKERIVDVYDVACELVALSNTRGGQLVIGINDKTGQLNSLSYQEVQETTNLLANMASENVIPAILLDVETVEAEGGSVIVAHVKEGLNKPYHDNKGIIWVKNGADKRKVFDNAELAEMMTECGSFTPDEAAVRDATIDDLDEQTLKIYLLNRFESAIITATVCLMCPSMSFIAAWLYYPYYDGFNIWTLLANWLRLICYNFPFAFFLCRQLGRRECLY